MKLLRAFIEASGYEIEEVTSEKRVMMTHDRRGQVNRNRGLTCPLGVIDYKVTKKRKDITIHTGI